MRAQGIPVERLERRARARGCSRASAATTSSSCSTSPRPACCARSGRSRRWPRRRAAHGAQRRPRARGARRRTRSLGRRRERLEADAVVWACGGWLAAALPRPRQRSPRRARTCSSSTAATPWTRAPGWVDYDGAVYGTGDLDELGVKGAPDFEGPPLAPDDELPATDPANERWIRDYFARRFPALAEAPLQVVDDAAATSSRPTRTSSPRRTPSTRPCGCSAAAPATASSTGRRWRSGWPPRCAAASRCPSASGSASARSAQSMRTSGSGR